MRRSYAMRERPHILLIDDNPDDRALVARELRRVFPHFQPLHVSDKPSFESRLRAGGFDLVITDYHLRWTDGLTVLRQVKALWPHCPVVMFTGTGSEEIAVDAMKAGLSDYVLKLPTHYPRLAGAAQRAIEMAAQHQELRAAETRFSRLFDTVPVGLYRATTFGQILDANPALLNLLAYPEKESLLGKRLSELHVHPGEYEQWQGLLQREHVILRYETEWRRLDGKICWVENNARVIFDGAAGQIEGSVEDITQRKEAENERERLILDLQDAFARIQTLGGLLPICASCKKIRDEQGRWTHVESYIQSHSEAEFTHSFCPDCVRILYPDLELQEAKAK